MVYACFTRYIHVVRNERNMLRVHVRTSKNTLAPVNPPLGVVLFLVLRREFSSSRYNRCSIIIISILGRRVGCSRVVVAQRRCSSRSELKALVVGEGRARIALRRRIANRRVIDASKRLRLQHER